MIQDETIKKLSTIGSVRVFQAQEYICYEGQPGSEMYVILKGAVGIYTSGTTEQQTEICRMEPGDFFGEMALLDNQPRSASCVALEHVVCAAIGKDKLYQFIATSPALAMKMLESLSIRIRGLSNALYKNNIAHSAQDTARFEIPAEYSGSHSLKESDYDNSFFNAVSAPCPICGKRVVVYNMKKVLMTPGALQKDGRATYKECDPLWHGIWTCPHCRYSNFYNRFFGVSLEEKEHIRHTLQEEQVPVIRQRPELSAPFDRLFISYLQAIHINRIVGNHLLEGRLWLNLYWLFDDANDTVMKNYCAKKSTAVLSAALAEEETLDEDSRLALQLALANMFGSLGDLASASAACNAILSCKDHLLIKQLAYDLKLQYKF